MTSLSGVRLAALLHGVTSQASPRMRRTRRLRFPSSHGDTCGKEPARKRCHLLKRFPSIYVTPAMLQMASRTKAQRVTLDQCACGTPVKKDTTVSKTPWTSLDGIGEFERLQCPGVGPRHFTQGMLLGLLSVALFGEGGLRRARQLCVNFCPNTS